MAEIIHKNGNIFDLVAEVEDTFEEIPPELEFEIIDLSQNLPLIGPNLANRAGFGVEPVGLRAFNPLYDDPQMISPVYSMRNPANPVVIEREIEQKHHIYLWRDPRMTYTSRDDLPTTKQDSEALILALALNLASADDHISVIEGTDIHHFGRSSYEVVDNEVDVSIMADVKPDFSNVPLQSSAIMVGNFYDHAETLEMLNDMSDKQIHGFLILNLDPREVDFDFKDNTEIQGMNGETSQSGETSMKFSDAASMRKKWQPILKEHIEWLEEQCELHDCQLLVRRKDEPREKVLIQLLEDDHIDPVAELLPHLKL